jgi:glycosyltransferase involved in cell wall biosynthesis
MALNIPQILSAHNYYQQPGGEDQVFISEGALLEASGHSVIRYTKNNDYIKNNNSVMLLQNILWNKSVYKELTAIIEKHQPAIAHFHNTFPLISPAAYEAAQSLGVPVVQTLHNYRLMCSNALLLKKGNICEDCVGKQIPWPGVLHACYRNSHIQTAVVAAFLTHHHLIGTWKNKVNCFIALSEFSRQKFIQSGIAAEKIIVKPNFVYPDPKGHKQTGKYALFVGRLSDEKGLNILLKAWQTLIPPIPLKIIGDGPLVQRVHKVVRQLPHIEYLGFSSKEKIYSVMREASFLIIPSTAYENFPLSAVEAYSISLPVICSGHGALEEIIIDGKTGLHFTPGSAADLIEKVEWAWTHTKEIREMGSYAREEFEQKYTSAINYLQLIKIYETAIATF